MDPLQRELLDILNIEVETDFPVAFDSLDHLFPFGTAMANFQNVLFNRRLQRLFKAEKRFLRVLDLGCAGGGFVKSFLDVGCLAVGIEGSDFSQKFSRAEWGTLNNRFLFTADITKDFQVNARTKNALFLLKFDVITAWEVLEHISEHDLKNVFQNIKKHLLPTGIVVISTTSRSSISPCGQVDLHRTKQNKAWWIQRAKEEGLFHMPELVSYFSPQFVRGPRKETRTDFHLVLSNQPDLAPKPPKEPFFQSLYYQWVGSKPQKMLKKLVI